MFCSEKLKSEVIDYFLLTISIYGSAKTFDEKKTLKQVNSLRVLNFIVIGSVPN